MPRTISTTVLAVAGLMALAAAAAAASVQTTNGVTVIRGTGANRESGTPAGAGNGSTTPPAASSGYVLDRSGKLNSLHTGSENAGGIVTNPPPGSGG
jgi:hypothetical protein